MELKKIDKTYYEETGRRLANVSQLKLFSMLQDIDFNKFLNIWRNFTISEKSISSILHHDTYEVQNDDWWDNISFKYYGTPNLWWLVALMNNVINPFEELEVGSHIKILKNKYLYQLLKEIRGVSEL
jgi:hypothetical protein